MTVRLAPVDTWPDLRVTLHPLPWTWKLRPDVYADDVDGAKGHCSAAWLFVVVEWWGNKRLFTEVLDNTPTSRPVEVLDSDGDGSPSR